MEENGEKLYKVEKIGENKGHGVIASKNLQPGQLVIIEEAGVLGPASAESCLECLCLTKGKMHFLLDNHRVCADS